MGWKTKKTGIAERRIFCLKRNRAHARRKPKENEISVLVCEKRSRKALGVADQREGPPLRGGGRREKRARRRTEEEKKTKGRTHWKCFDSGPTKKIPRWLRRGQGLTCLSTADENQILKHKRTDCRRGTRREGEKPHQAKGGGQRK